MKQIVMLEAMHWNEKSWARVMSHAGRVSLVQLEGYSWTGHTEVWQEGRCVHCTPPKREPIQLGHFDQMTFGSVLAFTTIKRAWPVMKSQHTDLVIANANSMAMAALFFRTIGRTRKVVCLVGDYFPLQGTLAVRVYRRICGYLTNWLAQRADEAWFISPRIPMNSANPHNFLVPIWIDDAASTRSPREEIGYVGMPSPDHALEMLFEICRKYGYRLNIIGDSPYLQTIKSSAPSGTVFHGLISNQAKIGAILSRCFCGYAIYRNTGPQNYSYYGFPSKILSYLTNNTPVVTTDTAHFMNVIEKFGIGYVVEPQFEQIEKAILDLKTRPAEFYEAISRFRAAWNADVEKFHQERLAVLLEDKI
jgi:glycosyltransferase involved in cell wall biosynthesis